MRTKIILLLGIVFLLCTMILPQNSGNKSKPFPFTKINFEQNATDGDVEVVLEIKADEDGLMKLSVVSPKGKTILEFESPEKSIMGIRQFRFESPEPKNEESLKLAYPEGNYTFIGETITGEKLFGKSMLSHKLPPPVTIVQPKSGAKRSNSSDLKVTWLAVKNISSYVIYIENEDFDFNITLPGTETILTVPSGYLKPKTNYTIGIGTVSNNGNTSFVESSFTTADK